MMDGTYFDDYIRALNERNEARKERDTAIAERDEARQQRDMLAEVMAQILNTPMNHTRRELLLEQALQSLTNQPK
jgi:hypothetical protein